MTNHKAVAKNLLNHYVQLAMERGGTLKTNADTTAEIDEIVECIVNAAVEQTIKKLEEQVKAR